MIKSKDASLLFFLYFIIRIEIALQDKSRLDRTEMQYWQRIGLGYRYCWHATTPNVRSLFGVRSETFPASCPLASGRPVRHTSAAFTFTANTTTSLIYATCDLGCVVGWTLNLWYCSRSSTFLHVRRRHSSHGSQMRHMSDASESCGKRTGSWENTGKINYV